MSQPIYIDRPPRIQPELPIDHIKIPAPPKKEGNALMEMMQMALPMLMVFGYMGMFLGGGRGAGMLLFIVPMMLMMGGASVIGVMALIQKRREQAKAIRDYDAKIIEMNRDMHNYHDLQRRFYVYNYPDLQTLFRIVHQARFDQEKEERTLRNESRLWERRTDDDDFGVIRLGMGTLPSTVVYELENQEGGDDPQLRAAQKLEEDSRFVGDIPVIISLRPGPQEPGQQESEGDEKERAVREAEAQRTPVTSSLGIAGQPAEVYAYTRSLLAHFLTFHTAADVRLYVLGSHEYQWEWADSVPHCQGDQQTFFLNRDGKARKSDDLDEELPLDRYLEGLRRMLAGRRLQLSERGDDEPSGDPTLPLCLLVVDLLEATGDPDSPLNNLEADGAISILLAEGASLGAAIIFLVPERSKVPSLCKSVIEVESTTPATNTRMHEFQRLHFRYAETGLNSFRYVGIADAIYPLNEMADLAKRMAEMAVRLSSGAAVPGSVPFMPFMDYDTMEDLLEDATRRWRASAEPRRSDWLKAKVGIMAGNKPRTLVFAAKRDGVHGIVAGSTGSGKSELLISMITAMAVYYDPSILNFVLVDFKGGGAFDPLRAMPHVVDVVTNLNGAAVQRMFTSITAELDRRQRLHGETETKDIIEYRRKGLHLTHMPYPHLFIIIDEFAEMISQSPEFKAQLESITRIGRSLGVSLILAAQRPSGVTDQMRSNIKYRICLRVESPGESRELLRRPDAAYLPNGTPGRGYLQVGNDEIELIQVAYSGDKYYDPQEPAPPPVIWPTRSAGYDANTQKEPPPLYLAIVDELEKLSDALEVKRQHAPWPNALPTRLALTTPLIASDENHPEVLTSERYLEQNEISQLLFNHPRPPLIALNPQLAEWEQGRNGWVTPIDWLNHGGRPVVGLVDNPYEALQHPLILNFPVGHIALFGSPGMGKTSFLRTMALSLAASHPPSALNFYLLDLGGRSLQLVGELPHCGAWITPDEEGYKERVEQLLRELEEVVDKRKTLLANARMADIYEYNARNPLKPEPISIIAIDNFAEFRESFGGGDVNVESTLDRFMLLARESRSYGVHFIITATLPNELPNQLHNVFTERFLLKLNDPTEIRSLLGVGAPDLGDIPGRGYVKMRRNALAFQAATLFRTSSNDSLEASAEESNRLEQVTELMREAAGDQFVRRVGSLPRSVLFKEILRRQHDLPINESFLTELYRTMQANWAHSLEAAPSDWLRVCFALRPGDRLREMYMEANQDGVHGLVAGGTGSGKSELLMTLIISLAVHYDPSILNFVLVDYKGGGAFKPFEKLPHVVDSLTNLNKDAVNRMFTAIIAEMERRQKLNTETGTKHIVEYRQKGYHLTHKPYPHLFIIIDEYAEMIAGAPEFKAALESIARLGRAQGVNLLLAAQRPIGVTDQMRANIKYRICLRVEEAETSREMLRRSDAAFLPNGMPGRGYLQVGNEHIELIQVAYAGENQDEVMDPATQEKRKRKFYEAIVDLSQQALGEREWPMTPWPEPLPTAFTFDKPLSERYVEPHIRDRLTQGRTSLLALNPFLQEWKEGKGRWHGVDWNGQSLRAIVGLVDDPYGARLLPMIVDFNKGHMVLFGASGWGKSLFFRSMVLSLAATHSPNELNVHLLDLGGRTLDPLRALPHVGTILFPDEPGYEEQVQQFMREMNLVADRRKKLFSEAGVSTLAEYNRTVPNAVEPALLIIIDNFAEYLETFGNAKENDPNNMLEALVSLVRQGRAYGIHFATSAMRMNVLGAKLYSLFTERLTLRLAEASEYSDVVGGRVAELPEIAGRGYTRIEGRPLAFQVALPPGAVQQGQIAQEAQMIRAIGKQMQAVVEGDSKAYKSPLRIAALPKAVFFREILTNDFKLPTTSSFLAPLQEAVAKRWAENQSADLADWLYVTLGSVAGNRPRTIQMEAKKDGVHGIVAGGTGSGKSELLMTLIVGLALNYSPDILNFVLVDYKGGGAFKPFNDMPHVVDSVTNLNKSAVVRMFTSINAEIRRRQKLNADTGTKDIVDYRQKGLHLNGGEPYPHLFIIIDEYAEMIDANEEFRGELESITRVGRAQGINLLLASQKPKGVTDQMRANIKLRLCLRVEDTDTSNELLRRPDAAFLPNGLPGRGFIQVGNGLPEMIQVAYTGDVQTDDRPPDVLWPEHVSKLVARDDEQTRLFDMAVRLTSDLVAGQMAPKPWPAFLPDSLSLQTLIRDSRTGEEWSLVPSVSDWLNDANEATWQATPWDQGGIQPVVGLVDDPVEARQFPLDFRLDRDHLVVLGDSGWGKSLFLRTLAVSLAATHSPDEVHLYLVDLGGRGFRSLEALPHLGAAIYMGDDTFDERFRRLIAKLERLTDERMTLIANAGANTVSEYNKQLAERGATDVKPLPIIVAMIDNFSPLMESYEIFVEERFMPLARRSLAAGICFVVTANAPTSLRGRLYNMFGQRFTFKQNNPDFYADIVGRGAVDIDEIPGRGYIRLSRRPLSLQAALPIGALDPDEVSPPREADELARLAANMAKRAEALQLSNLPAPIEVLPERVPLRTLLDEAPAPTARRVETLLGLSDSLQPYLLDLKRGLPHFAIVGPPLSGKTSTLYTWLFSLSMRYTPQEAAIILIDPQRRFINYGGEHKLSELPHVLAAITAPEDMAPVVQALMAEAKALDAGTSTREFFILVDNFDDLNEELAESFREVDRDLAILVRRYGQLGIHFILAGVFDGSGGSELRRRVLNIGSGIGLRTSDAVEKLRSSYIPGFRDRELALGRGYVVRGGQLRMVQVATPYEEMGVEINPADDEDELWKGEVLDRWVELLVERYPDQRAQWEAAEAPQLEGEGSNGRAAASAVSDEMQALVRRALLWENQQSAERPYSSVVMAAIMMHGPTWWNREDLIREALKAVWQQMNAMGTLEEVEGVDVDWMDGMDMSWMQEMDMDAILIALNDDLPPLDDIPSPDADAATDGGDGSAAATTALDGGDGAAPAADGGAGTAPAATAPAPDGGGSTAATAPAPNGGGSTAATPSSNGGHAQEPMTELPSAAALADGHDSSSPADGATAPTDDTPTPSEVQKP